MFKKIARFSLLTTSLCVFSLPVPALKAESFALQLPVQRVPMKDANSYAKDACKEWSKVSSKLPTTQKQLTAWLKSATKATNNAIPKASSAAKRSSAWNSFLGDFIFVQGELKYMTAYRAFSNAKQWDTSVTALKVTCNKVLSK
jgi:hypothetical protein